MPRRFLNLDRRRRNAVHSTLTALAQPSPQTLSGSTMRQPLLPLCLACALLVPAARAHASDRTPILVMTATEVKANANGHFITRISVNGSTLTALIDTGATAVALSYEDAEAAGIDSRNLDFNVPVSTANGVVQAARVSIDKVEVDGVTVDNVEGLVLPAGALKGTLLGMSYLGRLRSFKVEDGILYLRD
jgi:aspartyl protease family protein